MSNADPVGDDSIHIKTVSRRRPYVLPHRTDKKESDIEDIVIDGIARTRTHTVRYLCPFRKTLEPGKTYKWCTCGKSRDALCDDTCDDNDVAPLEFQVSTKVRWRSVCACRYTATPPFCDGVHALDPEVGRDEYAQEHGIDLEALDVKARAEWKAKLESGSCCGCKDDSKEDNAAAAAPATTAEATTTTATVSATNNNDAGSSDKQDTSSTDVTPKIS